MPKLKEMSYKQKAWVTELVKNKGNASEAARKAYNCDNPKSASVIGTENLAKLSSWKLDQHELSKELGNIMSPKEALENLSRLARSSRKDSDKINATQIVAKIHGMLKDKVEQEITTRTVADSSSSLDEQYKKLLNQSN